MSDDKAIAPKPRVRWSQISKLLFCGSAYEFAYVKGIWGKTSVPLLIGSAVHRGIEFHMSYKRDHDTALPCDDVIDFSRQSFRDLWDGALEKERKGYSSGGILFREEEKERGEGNVKAEALDKIVALAGLHWLHVAPDIHPMRVEWKWEIKLNDRPYDLEGTIDLQEHPLPGKKAGLIRDTKCYAKSPSKDLAHSLDQLTMYCFASRVFDGEIPELQLDTLVKTKEVKYVSAKTTRTGKDFDVLLARIDQGVKVIGKGAFAPVDQSAWQCSRQYCDYAASDICEFYRKSSHPESDE